MERMIELIESMNLREQHQIVLRDALSILAVAAHRLGLSPVDEQDLLIFVLEFIADARNKV